MNSPDTVTIERRHITLAGVVQGIGLRPTVYRLAGQLRLAGWVRNRGMHIEIEVEGNAEQLDAFLRRLGSDKPAAAVIATRNIPSVTTAGSLVFEILPSITDADGDSRPAGVLPLHE